MTLNEVSLHGPGLSQGSASNADLEICMRARQHWRMHVVHPQQLQGSEIWTNTAGV